MVGVVGGENLGIRADFKEGNQYLHVPWSPRKKPHNAELKKMVFKV